MLADADPKGTVSPAPSAAVALHCLSAAENRGLSHVQKHEGMPVLSGCCVRSAVDTS
jgi:hypothetical protein